MNSEEIKADIRAYYESIHYIPDRHRLLVGYMDAYRCSGMITNQEAGDLFKELIPWWFK
jgi:hypothetical protein